MIALWTGVTHSKPAPTARLTDKLCPLTNLSLPMADELRTVGNSLYRRFGEPFGMGRHRAVFRHRLNVIKLPLNDMGYSDNGMEAFKFEKDPSNRARCRLMTAGLVDLLVMEYVIEYKGPSELLPPWALNIDCSQVGYTTDGRLVAFDYA